MAWTVDIAPAALKDLDKLGSKPRQRILNFLSDRVAFLEDPRKLGKALAGKKYENQWRYRVGDYRIIAEIKFDVVRILVVQIGHRGEVYR
jgi:mRNA interferase RelE/StbE